MEFARTSFAKRLHTMLKVDMRRLLLSKLTYILIGSAFLMPVLILIMTTMMDGSVTVDPQTGVETVIEGFDNVWQIIGSVSSAGMDTSMGMTAMCNINLLYFIVSVLVCVFTAQDHCSGFAKNLFTVRARKSDYVISKSIVCFLGGAVMVVAFFLGSLVGGAVAGLPFAMEGFDTGNLALCVAAKVLLVGAFTSLYLLWSVIARQRLWLSLVGSLCTGMFLFMMIPLLTPLDAGVVHVLGCLAGGVLFSLGLGAVSTKILSKSSLV